MNNIDWNSFVRDLGPKLFHYFSIFFDESKSDDCVQETFIRIVHKVQNGGYDEEKSSLKTFSYGIARFVALEQRRKKLPFILFDHHELEEILDDSSSDENRNREEQKKELRQKIKCLSSIEQEILALMIDDDLTLVEIGEILSLPLNTVKSHVHRAKKNLRSLMTDNEA